MDAFVLVGVPFLFLQYAPLKHLFISDIQRLTGSRETPIRVVTNERFYEKHAPPVDLTTDIHFAQLKDSWR
jgi:hypothetical protein